MMTPTDLARSYLVTARLATGYPGLPPQLLSIDEARG